MPCRQEDISINDISMAICLRRHIGNPWVSDRLKLLHGYYKPSPSIHIFDFGSEKYFANEIRDICIKSNFTYYFVDDNGIYSASVARNYAFSKIKTSIIFFCDIDVFMNNDAFNDIKRIASTLDMKNKIDSILMLNVYHMNYENTKKFINDYLEKRESRTIDKLFFINSIRKCDDEEFIAPYSNIFLINKSFFNIIGGYDERFRGHGSEDFEFLIRAFTYQGLLPYPKDLNLDINAPSWSGFYDPRRPYRGFRAYLELASYPATIFPLRGVHLSHPRKQGKWVENNDWKRKRFQQALSVYSGKISNLISVDYLKRPKRMLCFGTADGWGYFLPFRLLGYQLVPCNADSIATLSLHIQTQQADAFAIFLPSTKKDLSLHMLTECAHQNGSEVVIVRHGVLPGTVYYGTDTLKEAFLNHNDAFLPARYSLEELKTAEKYLCDLMQESTIKPCASSPSMPFLTDEKNIIFISRHSPVYDGVDKKTVLEGDSFINDLKYLSERYQNALFVVEGAPLSSLAKHKNIHTLEDRTKNSRTIHHVTASADAIICFDREVMISLLLYGKPTVIIDSASHNDSNIYGVANSLEEAIENIMAQNIEPPTKEQRIQLAAWIFSRQYSLVTGMETFPKITSKYSRPETRFATVTQFVWKEHRLSLGRISKSNDFHPQSYVGRFFSIEGKDCDFNQRIQSNWLFKAYFLAYAPFLSRRGRNRLWMEPLTFFSQAKRPISRLGRLLFIRDKR